MFLSGVCGVIATLAFLRWGPLLGADALTFAGLVLFGSLSLAVVALFAGVGPLLANYAYGRLKEKGHLKSITTSARRPACNLSPPEEPARASSGD